MTTRTKGFLSFILAFIAIGVVWVAKPTYAMSIRDWLKLGLIELLFQAGFHFFNKDEQCK